MRGPVRQPGVTQDSTHMLPTEKKQNWKKKNDDDSRGFVIICGFSVNYSSFYPQFDDESSRIVIILFYSWISFPSAIGMSFDGQISRIVVELMSTQIRRWTSERKKSKHTIWSPYLKERSGNVADNTHRLTKGIPIDRQISRIEVEMMHTKHNGLTRKKNKKQKDDLI